MRPPFLPPRRGGPATSRSRLSECHAARLLGRQICGEREAPAVSAPAPRRTSDEPIAIVGMSCRAPGGVADVAAYWAVLEQGRDVVGPFPQRWDADALYDPDPDARGKS